MDVGCPFEFCGVGVAGAYVARLELLELLLGAEFVGLLGEGVSLFRQMGWERLTIIEVENVGDGYGGGVRRDLMPRQSRVELNRKAREE